MNLFSDELKAGLFVLPQPRSPQAITLSDNTKLVCCLLDSNESQQALLDYMKVTSRLQDQVVMLIFPGKTGSLELDLIPSSFDIDY